MAYSETPYTELGAGTDGIVGTNGNYVLFGEWPQTIMAKDVKIKKAAKTKETGVFTYFLGSDGEWYVPWQEQSLGPDGSPLRYSDGTEVLPDYVYSYKFFKA